MTDRRPHREKDAVGAKLHVAAAASLTIGTAILGSILLLGPDLAFPAATALLGAGASDPALETLFVFLLFGTIAAVALAGGRIVHLNAAAFGARPRREMLIGLALGVAGVAVAAGYAAIAGGLARVGSGASPGLILWGAAVILVQVYAEEAYFRGWLQPTLARAWGNAPAILIISAVFAGLHFIAGVSAPMALLNLSLGGLLFGALAARSGGIAGAVGAHFGWNAGEQLLLGLDPNPGLGAFGSIFDFDLVGSATWGGSEEGLNASLAMGMALLVLLVPTLMNARARGFQAAQQ
ncbi:CPBP family intramembrane glutamic endopeptidase [Allosphingosinicella deserti]|uniref:CAAX prenyl protease 2/Lysostaphin resistance protein A-like domain-containing protein n=1 Tax=Allosphingosinicella deserti TaxID=2116704 RepID=A0A2P7QFS7_9SPHN|nr:CPBP family intramembrane glutamic endopeptidase [Sphingomonas deserti]PSJ36841.1 hypothetical protein C7I55_24320 [Sphingomonas deserti]